jgi:hypothetical protein
MSHGDGRRSVMFLLPGPNLIDHYDALGDEVLQLLRQELSVPTFAEITAFGRAYHARLVERVFAPWLGSRSGIDRKRLYAQPSS